MFPLLGDCRMRRFVYFFPLCSNFLPNRDQFPEKRESFVEIKYSTFSAKKEDFCCRDIISRLFFVDTVTIFLSADYF
jgi:hypothetical protein